MNASHTCFRVTEMSEPLNAMIMTKDFLERAEQDIYCFKWAILAVHNALQGFMVLALKGTSNLGIIEWKDEYKNRSSYEILSDPKQKLVIFLTLFSKIKKSKYMQGTPFVDKSGNITYSIKRLNKYRNQFIHYLPLHWGIQIQEILNILYDAIKVISFLVNNCNVYVCYFNEDQFAEINRTIESCNSILLSYESN